MAWARHVKHLFKCDRWVNYGAVFLDERDRLLRLRRVQVDVGGSLHALCAIGLGIRREWSALDVEHVLDVVDLVHPGIDRLVEIHSFRNVAGDGHADLVGRASDGGDFGLGHRAIDLHLLEAGLVITLNPLLRIVGSVNTLHADCGGTVAVDHASREDSRPETAPFADRITDGGNEFKFVAAVAHGGCAGGQVDRPPLDLFEVRVHVPEAGKDRLTLDIDHLGVGWNPYFGAWPGCDDAIPIDENHGVVDRPAACTVDEGGPD